MLETLVFSVLGLVLSACVVTLTVCLWPDSREERARQWVMAYYAEHVRTVGTPSNAAGTLVWALNQQPEAYVPGTRTMGEVAAMPATSWGFVPATVAWRKPA